MDSTGGPHRSIDDAHADDLSRLLPLVYADLKRIAAGMLRGDAQVTLQPTALVHEAFIRVANDAKGDFQNECHFRAIASLAMRRILADHVRSRSRLKRGGDQHRVSIDLQQIGVSGEHDAADLDAALDELEAASPRVARQIVYRFFGDLTAAQAAERLAISLSTAEADWRFGRAWLAKRLGPSSGAA